MNPRSTDCEADALTTTPLRRCNTSKSVGMVCAIFQVAVTAARCFSEMFHCSKRASVLTWIPFDCLPRIKQLVEDFTNKMAKIPTN